MTSKNIRIGDAPFYDPNQSDRITQVNGRWYYLTRESDITGPYHSREMAQRAADQYIKKVLSGVAIEYGISAIDNSQKKDSDSDLSTYTDTSFLTSNVIA